VPEWYFLPFYAILRSVPNKLLGVILMFGAVLILFLVPWLDTSPVRSARFRPIYRIVSWFLVIDAVVLGYVGSQLPQGAIVTIGQLATAYYFIHFLILMPLIGKLETPRPLPLSIGAAVLGPPGTAQPAHAAQAERA
jgi:ubiquinol-cytochrome c reductase cytochrome b subunit